MSNPSSPHAVPESPSVRNSGLATATLVLGILGLISCGVLTIPAVICGLIAFLRIHRANGNLTGGRQVIAGLVMAAIGLLLGLMIPPQGIAREKARRANCLSNMKQIGLAIEMYADGHDGKIPQKFDDLRPYTSLDKRLICPSAKDTNTPSYQILLGGKKWDSPETSNSVVVAEWPFNHRGKHHVLFGDGRIELLAN